MWGPPASGGSTPLRETIPESPSQDGFPDFIPPSDNIAQSPARRVRAGTVPSRFSPGGAGAHTPGTNSPASLPPKSSRPTPSTSPFRSSSLISNETGDGNPVFNNATSALLSRLRAGSMPQRASYMDNQSPFGTSVFSTNWGGGRERASTLQSIRSSDGPDSPAQPTFSKDGLTDTDVKTLDYLGLAETPRQAQATLVQPGMQRLLVQPFLNDLIGLNKNSINRFRSYSVNAKEKYAEEEDEYLTAGQYSGHQSGAMTPMEASTAAAIAATQAQIHQHNLAVQAFATQASASRPRARTAGILDSPLIQRGARVYLATPSRLDKSMTAADFDDEYSALPDAVRALQLNNTANRAHLDISDDQHSQEGPTRALWLGNIPTSTTVTSLQAIFLAFGKIESTRVLVHKNCGFVNFESVESAIQAKSSLNGKEIFPGAGPVRIGYAKAPSASVSGTPSHNGGAFQSRSPDPYGNGQAENLGSQIAEASNGIRPVNGVHAQDTAAALEVPEISEQREEMLQIVREFGASNQEQTRIASSIDAAIDFKNLEPEISPVPEPSHARIHDAPKLREIRKRIDNNAFSQAEIEEIARGMLPEIAELASDYLGNTVVQKLFEYCSETVKEQMLVQVEPHLAEIGVHKNGTWAAQKIIDVAKVPSQIKMIVSSLRPYTVPLFLDQFGNYVLQCCLRFGYPYNNFIFETMLSRLWDIAQGRFGARAMRACLESHHATKDQQRMLASAITLHSVQLATNSNGALLLTWLLDTCSYPCRRVMLAPRLVPHLVHLCTHKVAYLTVLKVINQRNEPEARDIVLRALFFTENDQTLHDILSDPTCGATLIFKVLTNPFFDENLRAEVVQNVRNVLCRHKAVPSQGYKRLMDEVGLSARIGKGERDSQNASRPHSRQDRNRPVSHGSSSGRRHQSDMERQYSGPYYQPNAQQQFSVQTSIPGTSAMDQNGLSIYEQFTQFPRNQFNPQFQQAVLATSTHGISQGEFYSNITGPILGGYSASPSIDPGFRNLQAQHTPIPQRPMPMSPSPMLQQAPFATPPGFNPLIGNSAMVGTYQYPMQYLPHQQQLMQQQSGGRRGRVSGYPLHW